MIKIFSSLCFFSNFSQNWDLDVIFQIRVTVFHRDIQTTEKRELKMRCAAGYFEEIRGVWISKTPRRELKMRCAAGYFEEIRGVWMADETRSRVLDLYLLN